MNENDLPAASGVDDAELEQLRLKLELGMDVSDAPYGTQMLARVLNRIDDAQDEPVAGAAPLAPVQRRSFARRRLPIMAAAAACLAALMVVTPVIWPHSPAIAVPPGLQYETAPEDVASAPPAREVLRELARTAQGYSTPGSGGVQYVAQTGWVLWSNAEEMTSAIVPFSRESWFAPDGSARAVESHAPPLLPDGSLDMESSVPPIINAIDEFSPGELPDRVAELSRDPSVLRDEILDGLVCEEAGGRLAQCLIYLISSLNSVWVVPPDLNAAVWEMLADVPDVYFLGQVTDRIGRPVYAIAALPESTAYETYVQVLLVDLGTGRMVGEERVTLTSDLIDADFPAVTSFTTIRESRLVENVGSSS